jgi:RNA polymerase primary sigma factor
MRSPDIDEVEELIGVLNPRDEHIIRHRFEVNGAKFMTLEKLGKELGFTRERVRQLQNIALSRMAREAKRRNFISFLDELHESKT